MSGASLVARADGPRAALARVRCEEVGKSLRALLDQQVVAGIGNIYASEALHLARLSPFRPASTIVTAAGTPRASCKRLVQAIKSVLRRAISLKDSQRDGESRFRVYDREGQRCPTSGCRGTIERIWQAGRSTFYCPVCQR
jgi:formamidopyrimidine-DNA glycosylase